MKPYLIVILCLFMVLVSIQYTLNKILVEIRALRKRIQEGEDNRKW